MSIKTLRKRVALLVVSTLSISILSVISAPMANALASGDQTQGSIVLATTADADGSATNTLSTTTGALAAAQTFTSVGWVSTTSATAHATTGGVAVRNGDVATANMLNPGSVAFRATGIAAANEGISVVVTGGTLAISAFTTGSGVNVQSITLGGTNGTSVSSGTGYAVLNSTRTAFVGDAVYAATEAAKPSVYGVFTLSSSLAVGATATISVYSGADITSTATATNGTLLSQWQITVVSSSVVGVPSLADSFINQQACISATGTAGANNYDTATSCNNGQVGVVRVRLLDAYGNPIGAASAITVTATVSAGLVVSAGTSAPTGNAINAATVAFATVSSDADGVIWFLAKQPTANTAGSSTMTITVNGSVIATKTLRWLGDVATLAVNEADSCSTFTVNTNGGVDTEANTGAACVIYVAKDAAGNAVTLSAQPSVSAVTGALVGTTMSTSTGGVGSVANSVQTASVGYGYGTLLVPTNALSGAATYQLQLTNAAGATIKSQVVKATVSRGDTASFTASWDKQVYKPGEIATLTITAKDAYGNLMASGTALTGLNIIKNDTNFATVGTACSSTSTFSNGVKTCKYSVGNNDGGYAWSVALGTTTSQVPVTGSASIASGAISNAQVLAEIVKLIAAINKQIRAILRARR